MPLDIYKLKQKDICANLTEQLVCLDFNGPWENSWDQVHSEYLDLEWGNIRTGLIIMNLLSANYWKEKERFM